MDRRQVLRLIAGSLAAPWRTWGLPLGAGRALPAAAGSLAANRRGEAGEGRLLYLSAGAAAPGRYRVGGFSQAGEALLDHPLPGRGHAFAVGPDGRAAVHFARRPGEFALVLDLCRGVVSQAFEPPKDRRFQGHGVFHPSGHLLYATENDFDAGQGVVGVYDARAGTGFKRLGEFPAHGIGPHDVRMLPDGRTLAVANGGIHTHPDYPRAKLNLPTMAPSLCFIDRGTGELRRRLQLGKEFHQLGIRHLAVGREGRVAVAMQYEGPRGDRVPLVALCGPGGPLRPLEAPAAVLRAMRQYCGDVCFDRSGRWFAVSAPRGNLVTVWDGVDGRFLHAARSADCCGLAPGSRAGEFLVSSGQEGVFLLDLHTRSLRRLPTGLPEPRRWDNHLAVAGPMFPEGRGDVGT